MSTLLATIKSWVSLLPQFSVWNAVEVGIIAFIVYEIIVFLMSTRAWLLIKGILVILAFAVFAYAFKLTTIQWILNKVSGISVLALVVVFQQEIRQSLERLGNGRLVNNILSRQDIGAAQYLSAASAEEISRAVFEMGMDLTGALIVIENEDRLDKQVASGTPLKADISAALLKNIFFKNTPLHDGAVIIRGNEITAATCYLPLSENYHISKDLGTRHRAALGISEQTDCFVIVVSEETGSVTAVRDGVLTRITSRDQLDRMLADIVKTKKTSRLPVSLFRHKNAGEGRDE